MNWFNHRLFRIALMCTVTVVLAGYGLLVYSGTRADWELSDLQREYNHRQVDISKIYRQSNGATLQFAEAKNSFELWQPEARRRCMQIAAAHPGTQAEATALLMVASNWPESAEARTAHEDLVSAARTADIGRWAKALDGVFCRNKDIERWRPLVAELIQRVEAQPDHPEPPGSCARREIWSLPVKTSSRLPKNLSRWPT